MASGDKWGPLLELHTNGKKDMAYGHGYGSSPEVRTDTETPAAHLLQKWSYPRLGEQNVMTIIIAVVMIASKRGLV